ncbi:hypothetical protein LTS18_000135, partial [Coniosporium uncinatum]
MIKVQNGWERHSIDELERLPSTARFTPAPSTPGQASTRHTPRPSTSSDRHRRLSQFSESSCDKYLQSPASQTSPRQQQHLPPNPYSNNEPHGPRTYAAFWASRTQGPPHSSDNGHADADADTRILAPAADIRPAASSRRSQSQHPPPMLSNFRTHNSD